MEEKLISLETAKLAKEIGFDIPTLLCYIEGNGNTQYPVSEEYKMKEGTSVANFNKDVGCYSIPTLYFLHAYIRIKFKIHVGMDYDSSGWVYFITYMEFKDEVNWSKDYNDYDIALEDGLKRVMKEIVETKNKK